VLFDGVPDPANAGPMVKPDPVGSQVPKSVVLLNDGVDAPAIETVKASATTTTPSGAQRRVFLRITIPFQMDCPNAIPRHTARSHAVLPNEAR
jgi:hypothetical protein